MNTWMWRLCSLWMIINVVKSIFGADICVLPTYENTQTNVKNFSTDGPLSYMTLHALTGDVFIGGNNALHRLSQNLTLVQSYKYQETDDNSIKLVLLDDDHNLVVACGTSNEGLCYRHNLDNISKEVTLLNGNSSSSDFITSRNGSTQGIIAPQKKLNGEWENMFHFARTLDSDLPYADQQSVSSKRLNPNMTGFELAVNYTDIFSGVYSELSVSEELVDSYKIQYLYSFTHNGFTYFVTQQLKKPNVKINEVRLVRFCNSDVGFYSYMELTLPCKSRTIKGHFRNPIDAYLANVTTDFKARNKISNDTVLFLLCGHAKGDVAGRENAYIVCPFLMSKIEKAFYNALSTCQVDPSYNPGLEHLDSRMTCVYSTSDEVNVCPNSTIAHLHVEKNYPSRNILTNTHLEDITLTSALTSIVVTVYGSHTILIAGTEFGEIIFYHIGAFQALGTPQITIKVADEPINSHMEIKNSTIYAISDTKVYMLPIKDACRSISNCTVCIGSVYLQCGYCDGHGCMSEGDCQALKSPWSEFKCPVQISSVSPLSGPLEGGTQITICGEALGHTTSDPKTPTIREISMGDYANCSVTNKENYNQLRCLTVTNSSIIDKKKVTRAPIHLRILAKLPPKSYEFDYFEINQTRSLGIFSFFPVEVHDIYPHKGSEDGGTLLTIKGMNLNVGSHANVKVGTAPCQILHRNQTAIKCVTSPKNQTLDKDTRVREFKDFDSVVKASKPSSVTTTIDNAVKRSPQSFQYMPSPTLKIPVNLFKTIESGGIRIQVPGTNLESVADPYATISTINGIDENVTCTIVKGDKGLLKYLQFFTPPIPKPKLGLAQVTFTLDGLVLEKGMVVLPDPEIEESDMIEHDDVFTIAIKGTNLDVCQETTYTPGDIQVYVGDLICPILDVGDSTIICEVARSELENDMNSKLRNITVHIGLNLKLAAGMINISTASNTGLIAGIIVAIVLITLVVIIICMYKKRYAKKPVTDTQVTYRAEDGNQQRNPYHGNGLNSDHAPLLSGGSFSEQLSPDLMKEMSPLLIETSKIKFDRSLIIGKGNFGIVFHGEYYPSGTVEDGSSEVKVAIKTMSRIENIDAVEQFLREALIMRDFNHKHVLTLIGVLMDENSCPMVVLPFMKHGDLLMFIRNVENRPTVKDLVGFGLQSCRGMEYLASNRFVHRDLAARNCMLDEDFTVKVADFGLARDIYEKEYYKPHDKVGRMPVKWMSLESLLQQKFNTSTDVWSFGILMWELLTRGVTPYPDVDAFDVCDYLLDGRRLKQPEFCSNELYAILLRCWSPIPEKRPSFKELVELLSDIHKNIHGVHYPGLDVTYVNLDVHPYPSRLRSAESRSTGGSDVFSPATHTPTFTHSNEGPAPPPRIPIPSSDTVFSPTTPLLTADDHDSSIPTPIQQDEEGYLLPSVSETPKGVTQHTFGKLKKDPEMQRDSGISEDRVPTSNANIPTTARNMHNSNYPRDLSQSRLRKDSDGQQKQLVMKVSEDSMPAANSSIPVHPGQSMQNPDYVSDLSAAVRVNNARQRFAQDSRSSPLSSSIKDNDSFVVPPSPLQDRARSRPPVAPKPTYINDEKVNQNQALAGYPSSRYHNISRESPDFLSNPTYVLKESKMDEDSKRLVNRNNGNNKDESARYVTNPRFDAAANPAYVELPKKE